MQQVQRSYSLPKYEGYTYGADGKNGKMNTKMALVSLGVNALALLMGLILFVSSFSVLYNGLGRTGMIISALVIAAGGIGISETVFFRSVQVKTFYMVGLILLITMLFVFNNQVEFVVADDCVKAELYIRVGGLQQSMNKMKTDEMMSNVMARMKEIKDMDMLSNDMDPNTVKQLGLDKDEKKFLGDINSFLRVKLAHLQQHAKEVLAKMDKVLVDVRKDAKETEEKYRQGRSVSVEELERIREIEREMKFRVDKVQSTIIFMEQQHQDLDLTPDDYHAILEILNAGAAYGHQELKQEHENKESVEKVIGRQNELSKKQADADKYDYYNPPDYSNWKGGEVQRNKLMEDFWRLFNENREAKKFHEKSVERLPAHCMVEYRSEPYLVALIWGIILCLGTGMYIMCNAAFVQVQSKKQY